MRKDGKTNPVTVLLVIALAIGGFYGFHLLPLYTGNLEAKEAVAEAFNLYFLHGEKSARQSLLMRLNERNPDAYHYEIDDNGLEIIVAGLGLTDENVVIEYNEKSKRLTVRVSYDRVIDFKPFKKRKTYHLVAEKEGVNAQ